MKDPFNPTLSELKTGQILIRFTELGATQLGIITIKQKKSLKNIHVHWLHGFNIKANCGEHNVLNSHDCFFSSSESDSFWIYFREDSSVRYLVLI